MVLMSLPFSVMDSAIKLEKNYSLFVLMHCNCCCRFLIRPSTLVNFSVSDMRLSWRYSTFAKCGPACLPEHQRRHLVS